MGGNVVGIVVVVAVVLDIDVDNDDGGIICFQIGPFGNGAKFVGGTTRSDHKTDVVDTRTAVL